MSEAWGKMIHEKTRSKKSRDTVPLNVEPTWGYSWGLFWLNPRPLGSCRAQAGGGRVQPKSRDAHSILHFLHDYTFSATKLLYWACFFKITLKICDKLFVSYFYSSFLTYNRSQEANTRASYSPAAKSFRFWTCSINGINVFYFLSSLPLLPPATAVFGSYLSSLYSPNNIAVAGLSNHMMGEVSWDT